MSYMHPPAAIYTELPSAGAGTPASDTTSSLAKVPRSKTTQLKPSWLSGILSKPTGTFSLPSRRRKTSIVEAPPKPKKSKGSLGLSTLYEPPDGVVIAEMIFIHGLGGGSIKTWCDSSGPAPPSCWPRDWLPADAEFEHVRIHTFGYEADWRERTPSILSVHDFAQSLLGEMMNHQLIKRSDAGIVLVGHSMGGCVAKKAYILARQDPACADLASRVHSMFFLATPHRGSELGKVLRNLLLVTGVSKPYVKDLVANSGPVLEVNEAFHQYASDLRLWSFFESLPMSDYSNILVVDKHSATLGFDNESVSLMDADHRTICKFKYQSDHNYRKLRNALLSAVEMIKSNSPRMVAKARLGPYLGVDDSFEDDLIMHREARHPESCAWIVQDPGFCNWTLFDAESPPIYWLVAGMGAGKSIMCSRVVDYLSEQTEPMRCSYFFISRARGEMRDLSTLLLSIAFQMGLQDAQVRRAIVRLQEGGVSWEGQTDKLIWRKLFQEAIFNVKSPLTHFWIIDGLDEYSGDSDVYQLLEQLPQHVRVFVASQHTPEIQEGMLSLGQRVSIRMVGTEHTVSDMRFVVKARLKQLNHLETGDELVSRIVEKSNGSFVWIRLVLKELETAFTDEDIEAILEEVPSDLHEMYARILHSIEKDKRRAKLAKSILTWITLAQRPMTIEELRDAVQMDIRAAPQNMVHAAVAACGQFIMIDQRLRLHLVHDTARQFLCRADAESNFAITPAKDHGHLAALCLAYLAKHLAVDRSAQRAESPFLWYAAECFAQHLDKSNAGEPLYSGTITQFLDKWVLHWIESLARRRKLGIAVQSALNIERYAERGKDGGMWSGHDIVRLKGWTTDISRVVLNFREPLLRSPSAIHHLVPPFCPTQSMIHRHASSSGDAELAILGSRDQCWNECLMCIEHEALVEVVACGRHHAAIGLSTGFITVYDMALLQSTLEVKFLNSQLKLIGFGCDDKYLAATGFGQAAIWETKTGTLRYTFDCGPILSFSLSLTHFTAVLSSGVIERRNLETKESDILQWSAFDNSSLEAPLPSSAACEARFDETCPRRFAVAFYSTGDIYLMDIDGLSIRGVLRTSEQHLVKEFAFNPSPGTHFLAASYTGGGLALFNTSTMCQIYHRPDIFANHVSWTTDGKRLVVGTGESAYTLEIYKVQFSEAVSLDFVCQVDHPGIPVTPLVVASQGKRILGAHSRQSRIWEFPMLELQGGEDREDAMTEDESHKLELSPRDARAASGPRKDPIAVMAVSVDGRVVICGTESGEVVAFSALDGSWIAQLHQEHRCAITSLVLVQDVEGDLVITGDQDGFVVFAEAMHEQGKWGSAKVALKERCGNLVEQMLLSPSKDRLLIITLSGSELWCSSSRKKLENLRVPRSSANLRRAVQFPLMDDRFIILEDSRSQVFYWHDFGRASEGTLSLYRDGRLPEPEYVTNASYLSNDCVFVEKLADPLTGTRTNCWDASSFLAGGEQAAEAIPRRGLQALGCVLGDVIAVIDSTLIFLHKERWISTVDLDTFHLSLEVRRHFFIPPEWVSIFGSVVCVLTSERSLIFASRQDVVVVKGWMARWETDLLGLFDADAELEEYAGTDIWVTGRPLR
ncbi:hypothetical protein M440DRAFT_1459692 [Trichoderma longibrachiatum ATCC 18648]|uniref:GPI inositol-deacylase n=1 Tax=Trichoderma longibrachiatum ATCC 18648 TaxID=983965 RepID=A0A2T4CIZ9_TRILO|nr:hypothetical protein M440DRAFT_1459692 [Trichoderma longibrachiatum ATCC 18648]